MKSEVRFAVHVIFINNVKDIPGYFYKIIIIIIINIRRTTKSINALGSLTDSQRPSPQINTINSTLFSTYGFHFFVV